MTGALTCPHCFGAMSRGGGGGYRDAQATAWQCAQCGTQAIEPGDVDPRAHALAAILDGTPFERDRVPLRMGCPMGRGCAGSLDRVTLTWADRWVEIEHCARCGTVILGNGELEKVLALRATES